MHFMQQVAQYKRLIDSDIATYTRNYLINVQAEYGQYSHAVTDAYVAILGRGGKRLRGMLVMVGYEMVGGKDGTLAIQAARAIEMIHTYLLIIDDIADCSALRRGGPAAHKILQHYHERMQLQGDSELFGTTTATYAALMGAYQAETVIQNLPIEDAAKLRLLQHIRNTLIRTYHGQLHDTLNEVLSSTTEQDALKVCELKTAHYSIINPLEVGAMLGGAPETSLGVLREYGTYAGMAFQLVDDSIGIFGEDGKTGKSSLDDLREGKRTVLITYALQNANLQQRQQLLQRLGNKQVTSHDLEICRHIIINTGARAHVQQLVKDYTNKALQALSDIPKEWDTEKVALLRELTQSLTRREI